MNLTIDIGNTSTKLAVFKGDELIETMVGKQLDQKWMDEVYTKFTIKQAMVSSVVDLSEYNDLLKKYKITPLTPLTPLPLTLQYLTPNTLGLDRISAVVGAISIFKETDLLVIDMGTCITYDFVNSKHEYLGGSISPGFQMRFKALNFFTNKLPLVNFNEEKLSLIGNSTETSIISGVYNGMKNELLGIINAYLQQYKELKIVVTGGDLNLFDLAPKNRIFADKFLVLRGLNKILNDNEKK